MIKLQTIIKKQWLILRNMDRQKLLDKIDSMNERLSLLKKQGESSKNKTLKSIRVRRNKAIKELVILLTPETTYHSESIKSI